eukprot:PhM_4_TR10419/c0_g1_i2/m.13963/K05759/PFN; profilin
MSWQQFVDVNLIGSGAMHSGIIMGQDGTVWAWNGPLAHAPGDNIQAELAQLAKAVASPDVAQAGGVTLGGSKYFCIRAEPGLFWGKLGAGGMCALMSKTAIVVGVYGEGVPPPKHNQAVEALREYLVTNNM